VKLAPRQSDLDRLSVRTRRSAAGEDRRADREPGSRRLVAAAAGKPRTSLFGGTANLHGAAGDIDNRLEFHVTRGHASWLNMVENMVEIGIAVMVGQCLDRRIPDKSILTSEVAA
jgi:hypothetical protein